MQIVDAVVFEEGSTWTRSHPSDMEDIPLR